LGYVQQCRQLQSWQGHWGTAAVSTLEVPAGAAVLGSTSSSAAVTRFQRMKRLSRTRLQQLLQLQLQTLPQPGLAAARQTASSSSSTNGDLCSKLLRIQQADKKRQNFCGSSSTEQQQQLPLMVDHGQQGTPPGRRDLLHSPLNNLPATTALLRQHIQAAGVLRLLLLLRLVGCMKCWAQTGLTELAASGQNS
jgi:hypothetical protein